MRFEITTPEKVVLKEQIKRITAPTKNGEITVLPGHIPLVSILAPGVIEIELENGEKRALATASGFIEVLKDKVVILADNAMRAEDIDEKKALEAKEKAQKLMSTLKREDKTRFAEINAQIAVELAKSKAVRRWKKIKNIELK